MQRRYVMHFVHLIFAMCTALNPNGWTKLRGELSLQTGRSCECSCFSRTTDERNGSMSFVQLTSPSLFFVTRRCWQ
uniref:Putative secreted protein ovary overexpressed n=1 Tax=Rhipicephalus microplus TaxID=6941 RepID=A0A6M2DBA1_RHIMP